MPSISITERDFDFVAGAAMDARDAGDQDAALHLDKIARKMNLALSRQTAKDASPMNMGGAREQTWRDMPSTIGETR